MLNKKDLKLDENNSFDDNSTSEDSIVLEEDEESSLKKEDKIKELRDKLKDCEKEKLEYLSGWQRSKADFINSKKEIETEKGNFISFAESNLIKDLLPVMNSFSAAMSDKKTWEEVSPNWRKGVEYIYNQLLSVLQNKGLEIKDPLNEKFDPIFHEAVGEEGVENEEDDHKILKSLSPVFLQKGKVMQPAKVIVGIFKKINY